METVPAVIPFFLFRPFFMQPALPAPPPATTFPELAASRRRWIEEVLRPWCAAASRKNLLLAELEWQDIAGRPAPEMTLWLWAWGRFPELVGEGLAAMNETHEVEVRTRDGQSWAGFPDARQSVRGQLVLISPRGTAIPLLSIDDIVAVSRQAPRAE